MKILVIAPHADDEVLGCGASIAKYTKRGDEVFVCIMTEAYTPDWSKTFIKNRKTEIKNAHKILGIKQTFLLGYKTVHLDTIPQKELNDKLLEVVRIVKPDIVYTPHYSDLNKDHRLTFETTLVATRPIPNSGYEIKKIYCYEVVSETEWGRGFGQFTPNSYENVTSVLKIKIAAMKAYKSEIRKFPHPRSLELLTILAKKRGSESGLQAAEAFELIRETSF